MPSELFSIKEKQEDFFLKFKPIFTSFIQFEEVNKNLNTEIESSLFIYLINKPKETFSWFQSLFIHYNNKPKVLINLLRILGKLNKEFSNFHLCNLCGLPLLNYEDVEVVDETIQYFERKADFISLFALVNSPTLKHDWLEEYKQNVIQDLREELYKNVNTNP